MEDNQLMLQVYTLRGSLRGAMSVSLLVLFVGGCSFMNVARFDLTSYRNLTELKPEVSFLYETFVREPVDSAGVYRVRLKLAQVFEYERGKGKENEETISQIAIIMEMFERHVAERKERGVWSDAHVRNRMRNIADAFDIAIATEQAKNRSR